jgi:hypothetical protein
MYRDAGDDDLDRLMGDDQRAVDRSMAGVEGC